MEAEEQATAGISSEEETAVASSTEEPNAGQEFDTFTPRVAKEVEREVVPRTKTTRREVAETNKKAEVSAEESPEKKTSESNPEGGTTGGVTKEEAPLSEECHGLPQKAPEDCIRAASTEENSPLLPNFIPEDEEIEVEADREEKSVAGISYGDLNMINPLLKKELEGVSRIRRAATITSEESEAEAEEERTAERSAKENTTETSRTEYPTAGTEDDAFTHGKKFMVKKTRILSEERSKANTSARDGRSQLADPLTKQERLRLALMSGQAD